MEDIILIGGGGHCRSVIDVIEQEQNFKIVGIVDKQELTGTRVLGYPVIATDDDLPELVKTVTHACITVGQVGRPDLRIKLFEQARDCGFNLPVIVSPRAYVSEHSEIKSGTVVMHDVLINANVSIGENCIINSKALIEHDCIIGAHSHISTRVVINGGVTIAERSFIGSGAIVIEQLRLNPDCFIKAGSLVKST